MSNTVTVQKLKSAKDTIGKTALLFKKAQEGQMGPDEVKDFAIQAQDLLEKTEAVVETIIEEVPTSEPVEPPLESGLHEDEDELKNLEAQNELTEDEEEKKKDLMAKIAKAKKAQNDEDENDKEKKSQEEKRKEQDMKISKLTSTIQDMKYQTAKEKIATEYANLFDPKQRGAKFKSIMSAKDNVEILEARLKTAKELLSSGKSKVASNPTSTFELYGAASADPQRSAKAPGEERATVFSGI